MTSHSPPTWNYTSLYLSSLYNFRFREKGSFKRLQNVDLSVCVYMCACMHTYLYNVISN